MIVIYVPKEISLKQCELLDLWEKFFEHTEEKVRAIIYKENEEDEYICFGLENKTKIEYIYNQIYKNIKKEVLKDEFRKSIK